ncbi:peptidoglycan recognition protein family protein [Umezawaea tangerina]|uniref:N-acetylmuramoyl-L-alanine amidase n=1 Tax=Umezawaea tangerina TaxID=84725 RepID=A0A2T0SPJ8_9PSEU|nr:peptidoglycan recognition family protein [Umezawaea tangerina]PRY35339.1 N-acetylmuramoyl-L-alanine amidase [Umezawaea tangerina]
MFCPFAVQQIIPESRTQGRITPTTLIFHEAVSSADSLRDYWNSPGVELESHFYIGKTGVIYQFVDTEVRADANVDANGFAISVETWDDSNRDPLLAWNPAMLAAAKRLAAWCADVHDIPAREPAAWNSGGIGGHNWFAVRWAGGARQCPGVSRSAQIRKDIIPYVASGGGWGNTTTEDDMAGFTQDQINNLMSAVGEIRAALKETAKAPAVPGHPAETVHDIVQRNGDEIRALVQAAHDSLHQLTTAVQAYAVTAHDDLAQRIGDVETGAVSETQLDAAVQRATQNGGPLADVVRKGERIAIVDGDSPQPQ